MVKLGCRNIKVFFYFTPPIVVNEVLTVMFEFNTLVFK